MGQKSVIGVAVVVVVLLLGAVAAYAYDSSNEDRIANGVTVAGLDVGGLSAGQAQIRVRRQVADRLEQPITVTHGTKRFSLSAQDAGLRTDVGGMVNEALEASRKGNIISRVARDVTGGEEDTRVPARVSYSKAAARRLVDRVRKGVNRPAQDAKVNFPSLTPVSEKDGVAVKAEELERKVERALLTPSGTRHIEAPTAVTEPKITREQLASRYPAIVIVDRGAFQLRLYRNLKLAKSYKIAVGQAGLETPAGLYHIQNKAVNAAWSVPNSPWAGSLAGQVIPGGAPNNPLKARWMGIFDGAGIHGTDQIGSLGTAASHGCVRMAIPDVIELYDKVEVKTPVYIA
jgi:lipoprotein-anchoring transpeptidase ErfK/SrfK